MLSSLDATTASELVRLSIILTILSLNSYTDFKYRTVWGKDRYYFALGCLGFCLFLLTAQSGAELDAQQGNNINSLKYHSELFSMVLAITLVLLLHRVKCVVSGDAIIMIAMIILLPSAFGIQYFTLFVILGMIVLIGVFATSCNVMLNVLWRVRPPFLDNIQPNNQCYPLILSPLTPPHIRSLSLFGRIKQYFMRKVFFFTTHRKHPWERYVVFVYDCTDEEIKKSPLLRSIKYNQSVIWPKNASRTGELVLVAAPVIPFLLLSLVLALVVRFIIFFW